MMGGDILAGDVDASRLQTLAVETLKMGEYLAGHFDEAYADPRNEPDAPLLHALARGVHADRIARDEALGIAAVMFGAGGESTAALIGSLARRLAEAPDLADTLRGDPKRIPRFVEEVARLDPPFKFHYRAVRRACELGGFELGPGDRLMLLWASATRRDNCAGRAPATLQRVITVVRSWGKRIMSARKPTNPPLWLTTCPPRYSRVVIRHRTGRQVHQQHYRR